MDIVVWITCIVAWAVVLVPTVVYLVTEWQARRDHLFGVLVDKSLSVYYQLFFPAKKVTPPANLETTFRGNFAQLYGRRHFIVPLILLAIVSGIGMWVTATRTIAWLGGPNRAAAVPAIAIASFLGAYCWVLLDQFGRYQSRDFTKHNVYNGVYRLLISVPLGFSFAALANPAVGVPISFLLGAFPTQTLMKFSRRLVEEQLKLGEPDTAGPSELVKLQGIGRENAERFQRIDVTTIVQLAWADPVELTIRTNLDFNYIIDCMSQSLLWVYFGEQTPKLYQHGLRGAQEVNSLFETQIDARTGKKTGKKPIAAAEPTIIAVAQALGTTMRGLENTFEQIASDPYTEFICEVWVSDAE